ncbi:MAG TPA: HAD family hydrolase [Desulfonatronum sp.]|nr:HAD family hydrolase [Desulfonatronum sp.]
MIHSPLHIVTNPELRGLVLDCDGVILDSFQANTVFYNTLRKAVGLGPMSPEDEAFVHSHAVFTSLRRVIPAEFHDRMESIKQKMNYAELMPYLRLEPGLESFLQMARSRGLRLGIFTNRTDTMEFILDYYKLSRFFDRVETAATVTFPKPHPEGLHKILHSWNFNRKEIAFVGDSAVDEQTAATAGVEFWAYKNEKLRRRLFVPDFYVLRQWLAKRGG